MTFHMYRLKNIATTKKNIINQNIKLLEKYNINETKGTISLMAESNWKK